MTVTPAEIVTVCPTPNCWNRNAGALVPAPLEMFTDGPFCGIPPRRFDADLLRIRAVRPWTGNTADFLFGVSRRLQAGSVGMAPRPVANPVYRPLTPPARMELAGHLGVHVDRAEEAEAMGFAAARIGDWPDVLIGESGAL